MLGVIRRDCLVPILGEPKGAPGGSLPKPICHASDIITVL